MTITSPIQRVAVALFEGFTVLDVYGPVQAFASCRTVEPDGKRRPFFEIFSMAREPGRVKAGEGPASWAEWSFEKAPDYDILLVPGGLGTRAAVADEPFVERLATASRQARFLLGRSLGDLLLRVPEVRVVVAPDRADVDAARAAGIHADAAQDRLPAHERLLRLQERQLLLARGRHHPLDMAHQIAEPVRRRERRAALLVELPLTDRVGRAGEEAAAACFAETQGVAERAVGVQLAVREH